MRDDTSLLAAIADGDTGALHTLYRRHAPWLSVRLRGRCSDPEILADALQDTFVAVWRGADRFRGDGDVGAWLWGIGIRRLISRLRTHHPIEPTYFVHEPVVEDAVMLGIEYGALGPALAALSPEMRAVMQATVLDGLTTKETAQLLGIPEGTVKSRATRARAHLREQLIEGIT